MLLQEAVHVGAPVQILLLRPVSRRHAAARFPGVGHAERRNSFAWRDEAAGCLEHVLFHDAHPRRRPTCRGTQPRQHDCGLFGGDPPRFRHRLVLEARARSHE
eukprot:4063248-Alexandrium_andersonii.AAC.1